MHHHWHGVTAEEMAAILADMSRDRHASAKTTLDCYGHLWPDRDESTRAAVESVFAARNPADSVRTTAGAG